MGLISGLLFFGCNSQRESKIIATDSSGNVQSIDPKKILMTVRRLITKPISLTFEKMKSYLGDTKNKIAGITVNGNNGQVRNGFSISSQGLNYYGIEDENNNISVLCFYGADTDKDLVNSIDKVSKILATENLYLVNWIYRTIVDEKNIKDFFPKDTK